MPRGYIVRAPPRLTTAAGIFLVVEAPATGVILRVHDVVITSQSAEPQQLEIMLVRGARTFGGGDATAVTPIKLDPGLAAVSGLTGFHTITGSVVPEATFPSQSMDVRDGWRWRFEGGDGPLVQGGSDRDFGVEVVTTPSPPVVLLGTVYFTVAGG